MATRGWENVSVADAQTMGHRAQPKPSKYRNTRCEVRGESFDSKREAKHWMALKAREAAGEIRDLERQKSFPLHCPTTDGGGLLAEVCNYVADFVWFDRQMKLHVGDAKGVRTQLYRLKRKWMELEYGITIEEL